MEEQASLLLQVELGVEFHSLQRFDRGLDGLADLFANAGVGFQTIEAYNRQFAFVQRQEREL
jgi:hypothetical protein